MTTTNDTSPPAGLDLDAIEARIAACVRPCAWEDSDGCRDAATQKCAGGNCGLRLCDAHAEMHGSEMLHDTYPLPRNAVPEARELLAEARRLRGLLDATAQACDNLVAQVWRATGETHEPPADVAALLARVAAARREGAEAMREKYATGRTDGAAVMRRACEQACNAVCLRNAQLAQTQRGTDAAPQTMARAKGATECVDAIRRLPLPEVTP